MLIPIQLFVGSGQGLETLACFYSEMTKRVAVKAKIGAAQRGMPFSSDAKPTTPKMKKPRTWKSKQQSWMMNGLRHLKAPIVSRLFNVFGGRKLGLVSG